MKSFLQKLGWFLLFGFATVLSIEFTLRFLNPASLQYYRDVKLLHAYHPDYGVTLEPNESRYVKHYAGLWEGRFTTNSLGQRGLQEPDPNRSKILCLGDSMVMGFGVSDAETFCSLLDGLSAGGNNFQSINLGVDAYGSMGSAKRLEDMAGKLTNIKEVLFFISPNDYAMPEVLRNQGILPDDELDALHENDLVWKRNFRIQFEATRISFFLQALKLAIEQSQVLFAQNRILAIAEINSMFSSPFYYFLNSFYKTPKMKTCQESPMIGKYTCPEPVPVADFTCLDKKPDLNTLAPLPPLTIAAYERMISLSKKYNFHLRPVIIPVQVEEIYCFVNGKYHPLGNYALRAEKYWKSVGIDIIDITNHTKKMCGNDLTINGKSIKTGIRDYFIPGDGHFTVAGNRWLAEALKTELEQRLH